MEGIRHDPNSRLDDHRAEALRVLSLPLDVNGLHWHPFGVYAAPLAKRQDEEGRRWSRRLHIWHPSGTPVGEASPYGVHTHSGTARSHVLVGALTHHLYEFEAEPDGPWQQAVLGDVEGNARLLAHCHDPTSTGQTHTLQKDQPHGVTKGSAFAISLFEQRDGEKEIPFTTWQRMDTQPEKLIRQAPAPLQRVQQDALQALHETMPRTMHGQKS